MIRIPRADLDIQNSFRDIQQELNDLRAVIDRLGGSAVAPEPPKPENRLPDDRQVFVASGTMHSVGLVPDPGSTAATTKFLREDRTWVGALQLTGGSIGTSTDTSYIVEIAAGASAVAASSSGLYVHTESTYAGNVSGITATATGASTLNIGGYFSASGAGTNIAILTGGGLVGIGTGTSPTAALDINSDILRLRTAKTPASSAAAGNRGDICSDAGYIYVCTATNTWKRTAIAAW